MNEKIAYQRRFDPPVRLEIELNQRMVDRMTKDARERGLSLKTFAKILLTAAWTARCGQSNDPELEAVVSDVLDVVNRARFPKKDADYAPAYAPHPLPRLADEVMPPIQPAPALPVIQSEDEPEPKPEPQTEPDPDPVEATEPEPVPEKPAAAEPVKLNAIQSRLVRSYRADGCSVAEIEKRTGFDRAAIQKVLR